jgi:hypothetical protein
MRHLTAISISLIVVMTGLLKFSNSNIDAQFLIGVSISFFTISILCTISLQGVLVSQALYHIISGFSPDFRAQNWVYSWLTAKSFPAAFNVGLGSFVVALLVMVAFSLINIF